MTSDERGYIEDLYHAGLAAVGPRSAVARALGRRGTTITVDGSDIPTSGCVAVVAIGKAAASMAKGARDSLGEAIRNGIILTKDGHLSADVPGFRAFEAAHPVPDQRGVVATKAILDLAGELRNGDLLLALISGGGSALLEAPRPPLTLDDIQRTTDLLLRAGAPIQDLNAVRAELSLVKGGGLRRAAAPAACVSLLLSDVLGNDPTVIASGPTIDRQPSPHTARQVLERFGVRDRVPAAVATSLDQTIQAAPDELTGVDFEASRWFVIGDNDAFVAAAAAESNSRGVATRIIWRQKEGEAADLAREWVESCRAADDGVDVLLGGGEATVTVRGDGHGGRNTEFALAAAIELKEDDSDWTIASLASDGDDGATDAAGGIVDAGTVKAMRSAGVSPEDALAGNDSAPALDAAGALVRPGVTGTNVNDMYVAVRRGSAAKIGA
ncbi:MAG: DUF4147 domain-containing protein [Chloroflexia bacterium]|nr:DUF4147 domain-containing protein [Chloroflexia bacterium]